LLSACKYVNLGVDERGVIFDKFNGIDTTQILNEGRNKVKLQHELIVFNVRATIEEFNLECSLADGSKIELKFSVFYQVKEKNLPFLYRNIGINYVPYYIVPLVQKATQDTLKYHKPSELSHEYLGKILSERILNDGRWSKYFNVYEIRLHEVIYSTLVEKALEIGVQDEMDTLKSIDAKVRLHALKLLFENGSSTANEIILNHWSTERDSTVKKYIIAQLGNDK
jgi:hypothetical protein